jgi:hypothetical protein
MIRNATIAGSLTARFITQAVTLNVAQSAMGRPLVAAAMMMMTTT